MLEVKGVNVFSSRRYVEEQQGLLLCCTWMQGDRSGREVGLTGMLAGHHEARHW